MSTRFPPPPMRATQEEMDTADVPYHYRDYCAHLWIDYRECRGHHTFNWRRECKHVMHVYGKCEFKEFKRRVALAIEAKQKLGLM